MDERMDEWTDGDLAALNEPLRNNNPVYMYTDIAW